MLFDALQMGTVPPTIRGICSSSAPLVSLPISLFKYPERLLQRSRLDHGWSHGDDSHHGMDRSQGYVKTPNPWTKATPTDPPPPPEVVSRLAQLEGKLQAKHRESRRLKHGNVVSSICLWIRRSPREIYETDVPRRRALPDMTTPVWIRGKIQPQGPARHIESPVCLETQCEN